MVEDSQELTVLLKLDESEWLKGLEQFANAVPLQTDQALHEVGTQEFLEWLQVKDGWEQLPAQMQVYN